MNKIRSVVGSPDRGAVGAVRSKRCCERGAACDPCQGLLPLFLPLIFTANQRVSGSSIDQEPGMGWRGLAFRQPLLRWAYGGSHLQVGLGEISDNRRQISGFRSL